MLDLLRNKLLSMICLVAVSIAVHVFLLHLKGVHTMRCQHLVVLIWHKYNLPVMEWLLKLTIFLEVRHKSNLLVFHLQIALVHQQGNTKSLTFSKTFCLLQLLKWPSHFKYHQQALCQEILRLHHLLHLLQVLLTIYWILMVVKCLAVSHQIPIKSSNSQIYQTPSRKNHKIR